MLRMKTQLAACICIALTQPCLGDETLFTCKGGTAHIYTAEGGYSKPGWSTLTIPDVTKLVRTEPPTGSFPFYDIQSIAPDTGKSSYLEDACVIKEIGDFDVLDLDKAFVVTCKTTISTFLFYTRSGVHQLLETYLSFLHANTGAAVTATKDCEPGD